MYTRQRKYPHTRMGQSYLIWSNGSEPGESCVRVVRVSGRALLEAGITSKESLEKWIDDGSFLDNERGVERHEWVGLTVINPRGWGSMGGKMVEFCCVGAFNIV